MNKHMDSYKRVTCVCNDGMYNKNVDSILQILLEKNVNNSSTIYTRIRVISLVSSCEGPTSGNDVDPWR